MIKNCRFLLGGGIGPLSKRAVREQEGAKGSTGERFYSLLIVLPYVSPDALVFLPAEGWSGANADALQGQRKDEKSY